MEVIGFFLDEDCQIPVITQVLGNNDKGKIRESINGTTYGKQVKRYQPKNGNGAINTQICVTNGSKSLFEEVDPNFFQSAKK